MTVSSPCIRLCQIDPANRLCLGCLRSLDEIARWGGMTESERQAIMSRLPERKQAGSPRP